MAKKKGGNRPDDFQRFDGIDKEYDFENKKETDVFDKNGKKNKPVK